MHIVTEITSNACAGHTVLQRLYIKQKMTASVHHQTCLIGIDAPVEREREGDGQGRKREREGKERGGKFLR